MAETKTKGVKKLTKKKNIGKKKANEKLDLKVIRTQLIKDARKLLGESTGKTRRLLFTKEAFMLLFSSGLFSIIKAQEALGFASVTPLYDALQRDDEFRDEYREIKLKNAYYQRVIVEDGLMDILHDTEHPSYVTILTLIARAKCGYHAHRDTDNDKGKDTPQVINVTLANVPIEEKDISTDGKQTDNN